MKRIIKIFSAAVLASMCVMPATAWAATPSVTLQNDGKIMVKDAGEVRSLLVEFSVVPENLQTVQVTGVSLVDNPTNVVTNIAYDPANMKAILVVSAGSGTIKLDNGSLGKLDVKANIAEGAVESPVKTSVSYAEYLDTENPTTVATKASYNADTIVNNPSVFEPVNPGDIKNPDPNTNTGDNGNNNGNNGNNGNTGNNGNNNGGGTNNNTSDGNLVNGGVQNVTTPAPYNPNNNVTTTSTTGQQVGTNLSSTGDPIAIMVVSALVIVALSVGVAFFVRKKKFSSVSTGE